MYSKTNLRKFFPVSCLFLFLAFTLVAPSQANALTINVRSSLGTNLSGIKVYAFTASNAYTGKASTTDAFGAAVFNAADFSPGEYKFRCDYLKGQFFSDLAQLPNDTTLDVVINEVLVTTAVDNGAGPMSGIKVYLFNENGAYLGKSATTDGSGEAEFLVPADMPIKFRADVLGYQFWSSVQNSNVAHFPISLPHREVAVTVNGVNQFSQALGGLKTYLFTKSGAYMGISQATDTGGEVRFNLPEKAYKVRVDHLGQQYWSDAFTWNDQTVDIPYGDASVKVSGNGAAIPGVKVYVFTAAGKYLNVYGITDSVGNVGFSLPEGAYDFRADFQKSQFWADNADILAHQSNSVDISTGGGTFTFRVQKDSQTPMAGINCYVFTPAGVYLGMAGTTNSDGQVDFDLSDGQYKIRSDYLGYQYWSDDFAMPEDEAMVFNITHHDVTVTVLESFQTSDVPLAGVDTYLFTSGGVYMNQHQKTDANGQIILNLPEQSYTVRADYLKTQFWSLDFNSQDTTLPITMGDAEIQVSGSDQALSGVKVYAFTAEKSYLGLVGTTDSDGKATFRLPADEQYTFRADYLGSQYWSNSVTLLPDEVNTVDLSTGGGAFTLTVLKDSETPLTGAKCYVFSSNGAYLGLNETIDANGQGVFRLPDGTYRFRIDHLGYQFWTPNHTIPDTSSGDFTIAHQDVHVTVNGRFQGSDTPISGIRAYLFTAAGAYMGQSGVTDAEGEVSFNLPEQAYKIRADYLAQKYWTGDIVWWDESIEIPMAEARVRVTVGGEPAEGARIYVFNGNGAYLSINAVTDLSGEAVFTLPAGDYTFRADALGQQYWSAVVQLEADQSTVVEIADILTWQTLWGDDGKEQGVNFTTAADGGYVVVGGTDRNANMSTDVLMVKFDERGEALWFQTFGGSKYDEAKSILRADDGGYLIAGYGYPEQSYSSDAYLVKTDAAGTLQWEKFFGGSRSDGAFAISKSDQGYIVAGWTESMGAGNKDMWLFCIDHDGNMLWQKTFGGVDPDIAYDVTQTADGGYVVGGTLGRSEAGPTYTKYYYQGIFIKTDSIGAEQWRSLFGSPLSESKVLSLVETADGGIVGVINGISASSMKALVKLGEGGNEEWTQTFDDPRNFKMQRVTKTADGGLVVAGYVGGGGNDVKIVKADALGNQEWEQLFFGDKSEYAYDIEQTADGGYAIGGASYDLVLRSYDVLLIKTDEDGNVMTD